MRIACLSGKGGAGKTFVAVNLASVAGKCTYIDCDVEEPNGRLFLKPEGAAAEKVTVLLPKFDGEKCIGCKDCVKFCRFHALMYIKEKPAVFSEVCHSCGGCVQVCPKGAITEAPKAIGMLETGYRGDIRVVTGVLNPGEASGVPVIRKALSQAQGFTVIDCPPGSACSVMESVSGADHCLLVAEPTAFGLHNLKMVHTLAQLLEKRCSVVINKQEQIYTPLEEYCRENNLPVLARIPYTPELAALIAEGALATENSPQMKALFEDLLHRIGGEV